MTGTLPRRTFLRRTLGTAGAVWSAPYFVPSTVLGYGGAVPPSDTITVGCIGTGSHGTGWNLRAYLELPDARVRAVCDVDSNHMAQAKQQVDARYGTADCATTRDFRDILARDDIDAVMISTPDHWHVLMSVLAMQAGKDVQCEKPTYTIGEGKILVQTVRQLNRVFQTSTEDRSLPVYHRMAELVRNGRIGRLQRIEVLLPLLPNRPGDATPQPVPPELDWDLWLGPAPAAPYTPDGVHFNFRWVSSYSGGIICDWGTHLFDTAQWGNDTERTGPVMVEGTGTFWHGGLYDTIKDYDVTYTYANGVVMTCQPGDPSIKFIGTDGWVGNRGWRGKLEASSDEILNSVIGPDELHLFTDPAGEHRNFINCVKSRQDPYFPADIGHRVSTICHLANIAVKLGRRLSWDPDQEVFPGDDEANALLSRPMREPWTLGNVPHANQERQSRAAVSRRAFVLQTGLMTTGLLVGAGAVGRVAAARETAVRAASSSATPLSRRVLGRTGASVTTMTLGTAPCSLCPKISTTEVARIVNLAIDLGITSIDTAPAYVKAEESVGMALGARRKDVFLATKVLADTVDEAQKSLDKSFELLKTDWIDLVYYHSAGDHDVEKAMEPGGVFDWLVKQKKAGRFRFLGISGHNRPKRCVPLLETGEVDVLLAVINFVDRHTYGFEDKVLPVARKHNVGIVAMKVFGGARRSAGSYENPEAPPEMDVAHLPNAVRYALGTPGVCTVNLGVHNVDQLRQNLELVKQYTPLSEDEERALTQLGRQLARQWGPHFGDVA